jgi:hypothetical protein
MLYAQDVGCGTTTGTRPTASPAVTLYIRRLMIEVKPDDRRQKTDGRRQRKTR